MDQQKQTASYGQGFYLIIPWGERMSDDTLYFSADEVMKGIRLLYNEMDFAMFKRDLFPEPYHTNTYVRQMYAKWTHPFEFWCSIDDEKRKVLNFLIDEAASKELHRERAARQAPLLKALDKAGFE